MLRQIFLKIEWQNQQSYIGLSLFDFKQHLLNNRDIVQLWLENNLSKSKIGFFAQLHWDPKLHRVLWLWWRAKQRLQTGLLVPLRETGREGTTGVAKYTQTESCNAGGSEWIQEEFNFVASFKSGICCLQDICNLCCYFSHFDFLKTCSFAGRERLVLLSMNIKEQ